MFDRVTELAREPHWYVKGEVPDTLDGRFRALATVTALVLVRLERLGDEGNRASVALSERYVEVMESEHRELGLGDPALGRMVRRLVGSLGRRVGQWRRAIDMQAQWEETVRASLYKGAIAAPVALAHSSQALRSLWQRLEGAGLDTLAQGKIA